MSDRLFSDAMLAQISKADPSGIAQFPPEVNKLIESEFVEYKKGSFLKLRFPVKKEYNNPFHITFGGIYGMFFDMTFGPFSGLESGGFTSSLDMNVTFLKSLSVSDRFVEVKAEIVSSTKSFFIVKGEAHNATGDLVATCTSRMILLDPAIFRKLEI